MPQCLASLKSFPLQSDNSSGASIIYPRRQVSQRWIPSSSPIFRRFPELKCHLVQEALSKHGKVSTTLLITSQEYIYGQSVNTRPGNPDQRTEKFNHTTVLHCMHRSLHRKVSGGSIGCTTIVSWIVTQLTRHSSTMSHRLTHPTMPGPKIKIKYETDICVQYSTCV
jgi:hypothetical protein